MNHDEYEAMQDAVDIVRSSQHPANKVAATAFGKGFKLSRTNYWPELILKTFGMETDIGNSSGSVHAEMAAVLDAAQRQPTEGASLCVTDPLCPNCAKNMVEAGFKRVYVDHMGFEKDFYARRSLHFEDMSVQIFKKAGVSVYKMFRKDRRVEIIFEAKPNQFVSEDSPVYKEPVQSVNDGIFTDILTKAYGIHKERKFAVALAADQHGHNFALTARGHVVRGFTMEDPNDLRLIDLHVEKYSFFQEPVNRLMMYMKRYGMALHPGFLFSSQIPTSREQVNLVGAGIRRVTVGNIQKGRDEFATIAMRQLSEKGIVDYS